MRTKIKILRNRAIIRDVFAARFVMSDDYKYSLNGWKDLGNLADLYNVPHGANDAQSLRFSTKSVG